MNAEFQQSSEQELDTREAITNPDKYFPNQYGGKPYVYGAQEYATLDEALALEQEFRSFAGSKIEDDPKWRRTAAYVQGLDAASSLADCDAWLIGRSQSDLEQLHELYSQQG